MHHGIVDSPVGTITLVREGDAIVGCYMDRQRHRPDEDAFGPRDDAAFADVAAQLREYFAGDRHTFDLELSFERGTAFQQQVWRALRDIPYGETCSYGELAARVGSPGAPRAVGLANGRNPIGIIVPCHRVVGANGSLTGYGGGLERKQVLLDLERGHAQFVLA